MTEPVFRRLGKLEKFQWLVDDTCCVNNVVHVRISGQVSEFSVRAALECLYNSFLLLQTGVVRDGWSEARFVRSSAHTLPFRTAAIEDKLVFQVIETELQTPLPIETGPMARCILLRHSPDRSTLMMTYNHIVGDAMTGIFLLKRLLSLIEKTEIGIEDNQPPRILELPADEYFAKDMTSVRFVMETLRIIGRHLVSQCRWGKPVVPSVDDISYLKDRKAIVAMRELPRLTIDRLSDQARKENTTVHGALAAAFLKAIFEEHDPSKTHYVMLLSPVNLRVFLDNKMKEIMGNYASLTNAAFAGCLDNSFWDLARNIKTSLQKSIDRGEPFLALRNPFFKVNLFGAGDTGKRIYTERFNASFPNMVGLSNLGNVKIKNLYDTFSVDSFSGAATPSAFNNISSIAASLSNTMTWNFMGVFPLYSREHLNKLADRSVTLLLNAI